MAAWYGGIGPGALAAVSGATIAAWLFIEPVHSFAVGTKGDVAAVGAFFLSCLFIIGAMEAMHRARARALAELAERERVQVELSEVRELFAKTLKGAGQPSTSNGSPRREPLLKADSLAARFGERIIAAMFLAAAALLVATSVFVYEVGLIRIRAQDKMTWQLSVLRQLDEFLSSVKDAETGQRGYLITGEERYLQPFNQVRAQVVKSLESLHTLTVSGDLPPDKVERLTALAQQKLSELEDTIRLRREKGLDAAMAVMRIDRGKQLMDELRNVVGNMRAAEEKEFAQASLQSARAANLRTTTFIVACLLNLVFLGWAFQKVSREAQLLQATVLENRRQRELLAITLASIGDAVIVTDAKGCITFINRQAEELTGWKNSEAEGKLLKDVWRIIDEQTREPAENPVITALRLSAMVPPLDHRILIRRDGTEIPIDDCAAPIRQPDGPLFGAVLVFRDITERKRAERELHDAHEELARHATQLEETVQRRTARLNEMVGDLEAFSYSIVHDMRGPLRAMQSFAHLLGSECGPMNETAEDYLRRIKVAAERMDHLVQDGLSYSRIMRAELPLMPVDLGALIRGMIDTYPEFQPPGAYIEIKGSFPWVKANKSVLTQCISNLLGNAVKFVAPEVTPTVRIWAEMRDGRVCLFFKDNGIGIEKQAHEKIFQIFQRLDNKYEGTGIGLAIVKKGAERMGGRVGLESEPGKGSTFWLELSPASISSEERLPANFSTEVSA